ncbi:sugar kinase [Thalassotalea psychrophila]|uniref:Sugar kinase n=1 Tax=Thalassotalea psychrophila TaxID=3065647 RepID=A0ABY9TWA9_9GAMM|nr:sugar kinase [Colwelliaceae bacterium SQ149]
MADIAIIGEVMLEFSPLTGKDFTLGVSGDTYNSACTLAGLEISTTYITSLGEGQSADIIRQHAYHRHVHLLEPQAVKNKSPGLYMISNDETGERFFDYWRNDSAAKALLNNENLLLPLLKQVEKHGYLYFSGITLALMNDSCRSMFQQFLLDYRLQGGKVIFDPNYRSKLWLNKAAAISATDEIQAYVDIYLPGFEEEECLFGSTSPDGAVKRLLTTGVDEVVIKNGPENCILINNDHVENVEVTPSTDVVDTTGAGDTFNGGYIGARLSGLNPIDAINFAAKAASKILMIKGGVLQSKQLSELKASLNSKIGMTL